MSATAPLIIPAAIVESIGKDDKVIRLELAIFFYKEFDLSSGEAAKFAGSSRIAFWHELGKRKIPVNYDETEARQDVDTIEKINAKFPSPTA